MHKKEKTKTIYFQLSFFICIYNKFLNAHPLSIYSAAKLIYQCKWTSNKYGRGSPEACFCLKEVYTIK